MSTPTIYLAAADAPLFTLSEICERCGVHAEIIIEMVEYGIVAPVDEQTNNNRWQFSVDSLARLHRAQRLRQDLELNLAGLALSLELLDRIDTLQQEVKSLKHQLQKLRGN
ncbi:MAG TPA: chaperone modulator CbpM [Spongiibacteraceae bacterium]|jgi:chaperone modulatory protein CbpM